MAARWAWRHRRAILGTGVVAAGAYGAYVVYRKKRELEDLLDSLGLQQFLNGDSVPDRSKEARVREHFAATQREADRLLHEALPQVQAQIGTLLDTDGFKAQMRADRAQSHMGRWHELKLLVIARLLTAQYALVLAVLQLRIRLNLVSRHYFLETTAATRGALNGSTAEALSNLTKRRFLATDHLVSEGFGPLQELVSASVHARLSDAALDTPLTAAAALALLAPVRAEVEASIFGREDAPGGLLVEELTAMGSVAEGDQLGILVHEARQVLSSAPYRLAADDLLQATFGALSAELTSHLDGGDANNGAGATPRSMPLAKLIAQFNKLASSTLSPAEPCVAAVLDVPSLDDFCWVVYAPDVGADNG